MKIITILEFLIAIAADTWLLLVVWRRDVWKPLPWFAVCIASDLVQTCVGLALWFIDRSLYVTVFWWMEAAKIGLVVGAMRESFVRTFVGFSSLRWFPWVVRGVIGAVLVYSAWKTIYAPPVDKSWLFSLIIDVEFTFRWVIVAVGLLSVALVWLLDLPKDTRENAVMDGFAIASTAWLVFAVVRSFFGAKYGRFIQYVPDIGYFVAVAIWIKYLRIPGREFGLKELGMTPEAMALELRRYRETAERILAKTKGQ